MIWAHLLFGHGSIHLKLVDGPLRHEVFGFEPAAPDPCQDHTDYQCGAADHEGRPVGSKTVTLCECGNAALKQDDERGDEKHRRSHDHAKTSADRPHVLRYFGTSELRLLSHQSCKLRKQVANDI